MLVDMNGCAAIGEQGDACNSAREDVGTCTWDAYGILRSTRNEIEGTYHVGMLVDMNGCAAIREQQDACNSARGDGGTGMYQQE